MTNNEVLMKFNALQIIKQAGVKFSDKINYARFRNERLIAPIVEDFNKIRDEIIMDCCAKDETAATNYKVPEPGTEKHKEFNERMVALGNEESDFTTEFKTFPYEEVQKLGDIEPQLYDSLMVFVEGENA